MEKPKLCKNSLKTRNFYITKRGKWFKKWAGKFTSPLFKLKTIISAIPEKTISKVSLNRKTDLTDSENM